MDRRMGLVLAALAVFLLLPPALARAQDTDGDGILDVRDLCPRTRAGRAVDSAGCDAFCEVVLDAANGSAFLRSRLLEVGTADWGSFGTINTPPAGWHARPIGSPLGFVANPADDDWTDYVGDFFVPGTPEEGFGLNVGGIDSYTSRLMGEQGVVGTFTGSRVECRPRICGMRGGGSVYWSGTHAGIGIQQTYSVFNEGIFILIEVTLTNTTATPQTVYYMRNVDPDNMQTVTGDFTTTNTIVSQGDGSAASLALVSATTTAPDSYIALASSDPDARVTHGGFSNRDVANVWNCVGYTCALGAVTVADIAISLAVRKDIPAGESRSFAYVYTLSRDAIGESVACTIPAICGDGIVEGTEPCDDANSAAADGCSAACDVEPGWECLGSPSVCRPICGDGMIIAGEACDDGNIAASDGCGATCALEPGWTCGGAPSACTEICGDSLVVGRETCDTAGTSATCDDDCTSPACGDGTLNAAAGEMCDDANTEGGDGCSPICNLEECGNGFVEALEECDDSGESATCDVDCTAARCGDGTQNVLAGEGCDDANTEGGDGCSPTCMPEVCGNGIQEGLEECDDAGASALCDADCTAAVCGDGTLNAVAGESCDDGNTTDGDGCTAACVSETCGNGVTDVGEECDDSGESAACDADCTSAMCGDSVVNTTAGEVCDDGNTAGGDACSPECGPTPDAGTPDAGTPDAAVERDAGVDSGPDFYGVSGGGACAARPGRRTSTGWLVVLALAALFITRRRRG